MKQEVPSWLAAVLIALVLLVAGVLLYRMWAGGTQGTGRPGEVQAAPPVPGSGAPPNVSPPPAAPSPR
jgi:predicted transporter